VRFEFLMAQNKDHIANILLYSIKYLPSWKMTVTYLES